jgi:hypothetical protein
MALILAGVLAWQLLSGRALGTWWFPSITRRANPRAYWFVVAVQGAILVAFPRSDPCTPRNPYPHPP